ncbi:hypothetical protein V2G26_006581 [Clonostachys chloroleuca]
MEASEAMIAARSGLRETKVLLLHAVQVRVRYEPQDPHPFSDASLRQTSPAWGIMWFYTGPGLHSNHYHRSTELDGIGQVRYRIETKRRSLSRGQQIPTVVVPFRPSLVETRWPNIAFFEVVSTPA